MAKQSGVRQYRQYIRALHAHARRLILEQERCDREGTYLTYQGLVADAQRELIEQYGDIINNDEGRAVPTLVETIGKYRRRRNRLAA